MGKSKDKRKSESEEASGNHVNDVTIDDGDEKVSWEEKTRYLTPISKPLASKRLTKKLYKTVRKASKCNSLRKGIKEVQKSIRKGEKGIVVLAGDVTPFDIMSHVPVMCEEGGLQYCFVPSKKELGESIGTKKQACMVLIKEHESLLSDFSECKSKINEILVEY